MTDEKAIADHWARGDVYALIVAALGKMSKPLDALTLEDLAPVDHFHARGLTATVELADRLPIKARQHIVDIGCELGIRIAVQLVPGHDSLRLQAGLRGDSACGCRIIAGNHNHADTG